MTPAQGATQLYGFMSPYPQLKGPPKIVGFKSAAKTQRLKRFYEKNPISPKSPPILTNKNPQSY